jgi:hypothetical protein
MGDRERGERCGAIVSNSHPLSQIATWLGLLRVLDDDEPLTFVPHSISLALLMFLRIELSPLTLTNISDGHTSPHAYTGYGHQLHVDIKRSFALASPAPKEAYAVRYVYLSLCSHAYGVGLF